jgi:hypothetical protein
MTALGFAMRAAATAGPVIHVDGSGPEKRLALFRGLQQARPPADGSVEPGFYDSLATSGDLPHEAKDRRGDAEPYSVFSYT